MTLTPAFDPDVVSYTATAEEASDTVTATATDPLDIITVTVNDVTILNGGTAEWVDGDNAVAVTVTDSVDSSLTNTYTVTVSYEESEG